MRAPVYALRGVVAGCPFATTFIRVTSLEGLGAITWRPFVRYSLNIDDHGIHAVGCYQDVLTGAIQGSQQLARVISGDIGASLSEDNAALLVPNKALGKGTHDVLGPALTGPIVQAAVNHGVDDSAGLPQRH
eukprot:7006719-Pyramimonas_sp.AAC.2